MRGLLWFPATAKKDEGLVTQLATEAESLANSTPLPRSAGGKIENRNFAKQELDLACAFSTIKSANHSVHLLDKPVSLEGQQQLTQNLSNNNLTSTTGTSSLILTQD